MIEAASEAGTKVRQMAATGLVARSKADASPVTDADEAAEAIIEKHLHALLPGVPMIGEEAVANGSNKKPGSTFFLVDPIDGTREFIAKRPEYTVNIGLLIDGTPALGVIYAPALSELYAGGANGAVRLALAPGMNPAQAVHEPIQVRAPAKQLVAVVSHSHLDSATTAWLKRHAIAETIRAGSPSSSAVSPKEKPTSTRAFRP
jgi:3'(2'), 5'-bisphosphate nucleotidase